MTNNKVTKGSSSTKRKFFEEKQKRKKGKKNVATVANKKILPANQIPSREKKRKKGRKAASLVEKYFEPSKNEGFGESSDQDFDSGPEEIQLKEMKRGKKSRAGKRRRKMMENSEAVEEDAGGFVEILDEVPFAKNSKNSEDSENSESSDPEIVAEIVAKTDGKSLGGEGSFSLPSRESLEFLSAEIWKHYEANRQTKEGLEVREEEKNRNQVSFQKKLCIFV